MSNTIRRGAANVSPPLDENDACSFGKDLDAFGDSVNRIQDIGFKKIENQLQKPVIGEIMNLLRDAGAPGVGMSSFGPTIYAITDSVKDIVSAAHDALEGVGGYVMESEAQNYGCIYR